MPLEAGTSGYCYKEWRGHFYPDKLPESAMLGYYATRLPTVEINNTFYRMPALAMLERWAQELPGSPAPDALRRSRAAGVDRTHCAQPLTRAYVYFMHEDQALGARFALLMNELWQRSVRDGVASSPRSSQ